MERTLLSAADVRAVLDVEGRPQPVINLASLDYLGICRHPDVVEAQREALLEWGSGACGVPLLSGTTRVHRELEREMSALARTGGAILFTSGFAGAIGLCSALLRRGDVAVLDDLAHMSWMDGVRMAGATLVRFRHNDAESLDRTLAAHAGKRRIVVVDGLYSMDGDLADLPRLLDVADAHGVGMVVDEAHSMFALGPRGGGATAHFGEQKRVRVQFGTFSKALSVVGAFAAADAGLLDYVRYYAHPYVFSAALPPATAVGIRRAVAVAAAADDARATLASNARYFRESLNAMGLDTGASVSYVVPVIVGDDRRLLYEGVRELMLRGVYVAPVDYPAVPADRVRFRCALSAGHTREDLDQALGHIGEVFAAARAR
jgi:7-keto-8-aminopelargonate synthetase-like enzyme